MRNNFTWILFLIVPCVLVRARPVHEPLTSAAVDPQIYNYNAHNIPKHEDTLESRDEQVISVRITSSVAVGRGRGKLSKILEDKPEISESQSTPLLLVTEVTASASSVITENLLKELEIDTTEIPQNLVGANIEFIKQLHSKKEARGLHNFEKIHSFQTNSRNEYFNETDDTIAEPSIKSVLEITSKEENNDHIQKVPLARSLSPSSKNYIQGLTHKPLSERGNNPRLTTAVSFNIVHDTPKPTGNYNEPSDTYVNSRQAMADSSKFYIGPPKFYNEPSKVYSQPAQVYSEPAKFYSEPAKIYSEPAKIYSEPAKIYSEPAKIYSKPAKFYSQPASLHLPPDTFASVTPWLSQSQSPAVSSTIMSTTPVTTLINPTITSTEHIIVEQHHEKNYEVDEKESVLSDGQSHGVQDSTTENCKQENCKVGYVVEGRQYRKYRVEERTSDGFIVGEYGVVRNEDGALRGVRYTADSDASPRLIYDALMKFLQLK